MRGQGRPSFSTVRTRLHPTGDLNSEKLAGTMKNPSDEPTDQLALWFRCKLPEVTGYLTGTHWRNVREYR